MLKSIYMIQGSCRSSHTEHHKIGFAIFGFLYELILNLQVTESKGKSGKNLIALIPLELLNLQNYALAFNTQALGDNSPSQQCPPAAGQARRRRAWAGGGNKRGGCAIGLTCGWIAVVARTERRPVMAGGEAVAARPPRLGLR
jgi:hypothetical protein